MTLNLWGYNDWSSRESNILALIKKIDPDIITLQEVEIDSTYSELSQSENIAKICGYEYHVFKPAFTRESSFEQKNTSDRIVTHGLAVLSKYPIISSQSYRLRKQRDFNEPCIALITNIDVDGHILDLWNIHLANTDKHSDLHIRELMLLCSSRSRTPIIQGDFNIYNLDDYSKNILSKYCLSSEKLKYISMPKDNGTLDYIIIPVTKYKFEKVSCPTDYVSDHMAIVAFIEILKK